MSEGTIVTFYSYKGGVGRTFALANIGTLLSLWGYKVLCIDWDLEAPGLHLYFKPWIQRKNRRGLIEMIQAYTKKTPHWQDFVTEVNIPEAKEPLLLMKAGLQNKSYIPHMQALDWDALYDNHDLGNKLEQLRSDWKKHFDFVLIDSRTGVSDTGSICTVQLPDTLLMFLTANDQSLEGSLTVLGRIQAARSNFRLDRARLLVVPILSRFERRVEYALADKWIEKCEKRLAPIYKGWLEKDIKVTDLFNHIRIPYIPIWSFGEELPVIEKTTLDSEDVGFYLETLAALVAKNFAYTDILVRNRASFIEAARSKLAIKRTATQQEAQVVKGRIPVRLFLSYAVSDQPFYDQLELYLAVLRQRSIIDEWYADPAPSGPNPLPEAINLRLQEANIILLLISPDYLSSATGDAETQQAIAKHNSGHAIAIPIILKPTDWQALPLRAPTALPSNGVAVTEWRNRNEAWADVMSGIQRAIEDWRKPSGHALRNN